MIRLFVIEDHPVIVSGLRSMFRPLRDGIEVGGSSGNVKDVPEFGESASFDLFILDLWLGESDPIENIKDLRQRFPEKPVIVYTSEISSLWQRKMITAGARAYLIKTGVKSEIRAAIEKVMAGGSVFSIPFQPVADAAQKKPSAVIPDGITENHIEIIRMVSMGYPLSRIAEETGTSYNNIAKTLVRIRKVFGAENNPGLIRIAISQGLI
jgi:two-component system invasion response regulator UvrY